jgi:hypothetical protein
MAGLFYEQGPPDQGNRMGVTVATYRDMDDVRRANRNAGLYFFEVGAARFFRSRIGTTLYGGRYFVTSEQFVDGRGNAAPRRYTVREVGPDGGIDTVGEFQAYESGAAARRAIQQLVNGEG